MDNIVTVNTHLHFIFDGCKNRCVRNVAEPHALFAADPLRSRSVQAAKNRLNNAPVERYRACKEDFQCLRGRN